MIYLKNRCEKHRKKKSNINYIYVFNKNERKRIN